MNQGIEFSTLSEKQQLKSSTLTKNQLKPNSILIAIASNVQNPHLLAAGVKPGVNVIVLDENRDGIEQITAALTHYSASSLHIVCHGSPGVLKLGKTTLSSENISHYSHLLQEWGVNNILLWSCEVAAENTDFLEKLHQLTGANIAASADFVGNDKNYSNWKLEYQIGNITEPISIFTEAILERYSGLFTDPGDNFITAQNIGVLGANQTFTEAVGTTDRADWYRFTLNQISEVDLDLTGLTDVAELSIVTDLDSDGVLDNNEVIEGDDVSPYTNGDRNISKTLSPGTYAIRVFTPFTDNNTNYSLSASATILPPTNATDPGENFNTTVNIDPLRSTPRTFTNAVGSVDLSDFYEFTLDEISQVSFNLTGLTDVAELSIVTDLDNDGVLDNNEVIEVDDVSPYASNDRGISKTLSPGTYAIRVYIPFIDNNTGYTLSTIATAQPPTNATDPGEDFDSALNLGRLGGTQTFTDAVGSVDRNDYYQFTVDQTSTIAFNLTGLTDPAELAIVTDLDNDGVLDNNEVIETDDVSPYASNDRGISTTLSPGTYAIRVYAPFTDNNTGYTLTTVAPGTPEPPDKEIEYDSQAFTVNGVYEPIPGDFNGDENGDVLWYSPGTGADFLWSFNDDNTYESEPFTVNGDYTPIPGDFDGSGTTDILWYRPGGGADFLWSFNSDGSYNSSPFTVNGDYTPVTGDFDGSGTTDILWYRPGTGADFLWSFNDNGTYDSEPFTVNGDYDPITGDFDGSGTTDILWYKAGTGADFLWSFNDDGTYDSESFTVNGVYEPIEGDFNGDDIDDILWYAPGAGNDFIWAFQADGTYDSTAFTINGVYEPVVEDFDSNGFTDILWYRAGVGADYLWSFE